MKKYILLAILYFTVSPLFSQSNNSLNLSFTPYPTGRFDKNTIIGSLQYGRHLTKSFETGLGFGYGILRRGALPLASGGGSLENIEYFNYYAYANYHLLPKTTWLDLYIGSRIGGLQRISPKGFLPSNRHFFNIEGNIGSVLYVWKHTGFNLEYGISNRFIVDDTAPKRFGVWRIGLTVSF